MIPLLAEKEPAEVSVVCMSASSNKLCWDPQVNRTCCKETWSRLVDDKQNSQQQLPPALGYLFYHLVLSEEIGLSTLMARPCSQDHKYVSAAKWRLEVDTTHCCLWEKEGRRGARIS